MAHQQLQWLLVQYSWKHLDYPCLWRVSHGYWIVKKKILWFAGWLAPKCNCSQLWARRDWGWSTYFVRTVGTSRYHSVRVPLQGSEKRTKWTQIGTILRGDKKTCSPHYHSWSVIMAYDMGSCKESSTISSVLSDDSTFSVLDLGAPTGPMWSRQIPPFTARLLFNKYAKKHPDKNKTAMEASFRGATSTTKKGIQALGKCEDFMDYEMQHGNIIQYHTAGL